MGNESFGTKIYPRHTEEETKWAQDVNARLVKSTMKSIISSGILEEYHQKFNKTLTSSGMYTWLRYTKFPNIKREAYARQKARIATGGALSPNAKFLKEKDTFEKSNVLAYINHNIVGFETDAELTEFLKKNSVVSGNIHVFRRLPITIEYNVKLGI